MALKGTSHFHPLVITSQTQAKVLLAKRLLLWVIAATRSLAVNDLRHALATCPDTHRFDSSRLVREGTLVGLCRGLVMVEEETRLVRLVHYTAKDILERLIMETFPQPHALVSAVCLAQLTDNGFQQTTFGEYWRLEEALETKPLLGYAYSSWSLNGRGFFDVLGLLHLVAYFNLSTAFAGCANVRNPNQRTAKRCLTGLHLACMQGHDDAVKQLLQLPGLSVNAIDTDSLTALIWASDRGNEGVVRLLLAHPDISVNALDAFGGTALIWASRHGHKGVVTALLSHPDTNLWIKATETSSCSSCPTPISMSTRRIVVGGLL
ncbi:ankyrin repeat-containing domain protein [Coprinopsis sp. MPI-PUGE-AT-0042]|nr:ankyrin repeat-containing domain protein [Coprinopsis sp. MPI-PUGE-AT-0042]